MENDMSLRFLLELQKLNVEDQGGVRWDDPRMTSGAVRVIGAAGERGAFTDRHLGDTFIPSLDDLSFSDLELERLFAVPRRIELLAVGQGAGVVHDHGLSCPWIGAAITLSGGLHVDSHDEI